MKDRIMASPALSLNMLPGMDQAVLRELGNGYGLLSWAMAGDNHFHVLVMQQDTKGQYHPIFNTAATPDGAPLVLMADELPQLEAQIASFPAAKLERAN